jgi:hypothetical protein
MASAEVALLGTVGLVGDALAARPADLEFHRVRRRARSRSRLARRTSPARRRFDSLSLEARP